MGNWGDYQREERERLKAGDYRVCVTWVEEATSKAGNDMIIVTVKPSGSEIKIKHYIVKNEYFNKNMTEFFDSFAPEIEEGNFDFIKWIGAEGAAKLIEDENGYLKVRYFISKDKAEKLPPWEGEKPDKNEITTLTVVDDENIPF